VKKIRIIVRVGANAVFTELEVDEVLLGRQFVGAMGLILGATSQDAGEISEEVEVIASGEPMFFGVLNSHTGKEATQRLGRVFCFPEWEKLI
jgi:hypothetical protein